MLVSSKFKGFTLLELIVAMAIIAVLIGLSLLGIQTVQRSARDTERRSYVDAINLEITDYYGSKSAYPAVGTVAITRTVTPKIVTIGTLGKTVQLKGAGIPRAASDTVSDSSGSVYCYGATGNTYSIGVNLESGTWFTLGNATAPCGAANL